MKFIVHTGPGCVQCKQTIRRIEAKGGTVELYDAEQPEFEQYFGSRQLPGVIAVDIRGVAKESWTGFRPDKIDHYLK